MTRALPLAVVFALALPGCSETFSGVNLTIHATPGLEAITRLQVVVGYFDDAVANTESEYFHEDRPQPIIELERHGPLPDNPYFYQIPRETVNGDYVVIVVVGFDSAGSIVAMAADYPKRELSSDSIDVDIFLDGSESPVSARNNCLYINSPEGPPDDSGAVISFPADRDCDGFGFPQDCDDFDPTRYPTATDCAGEDLNCDNMVDPGQDDDCDGVPASRDCDDGDPTQLYYLAPELCSPEQESCGCQFPAPSAPCYSFASNGACVVGLAQCAGDRQLACDNANSTQQVPDGLCLRSESQCAGKSDVTACVHEAVAEKTLHCFQMVDDNSCQIPSYTVSLGDNPAGGCQWELLADDSTVGFFGFGGAQASISDQCEPSLTALPLPGFDHTSFDLLLLRRTANDNRFVRVVVTPIEEHSCEPMAPPLPLCIDPALEDPTIYFGHETLSECLQ